MEDGERGETDIVTMEIDTGEAQPKHHPVRRTRFAARQEIARQLREMQAQKVITPSDSHGQALLCWYRKRMGCCISVLTIEAPI